MLEGKEVRVEHDLQERDKYGRLFLVTKKNKKGVNHNG